MSDNDGDMATMPIPDLVAGIRKKVESMEPLQALVMGILSGRLMQEHERGNEHARLSAQAQEEAKSLEGDLSRTMAALGQMESNFNGMLKQRNKLADALDEQGIDSDGVLAEDDRQ